MFTEPRKGTLAAMIGTVAFAAFAFAAAPAVAQKGHSGSGGGGGSHSTGHDDEGGHEDDGSHAEGHESGSSEHGARRQGQGQQGGRGQGSGRASGGHGSSSLRDIFRELADEAEDERRGRGPQAGQGAGGQGGAGGHEDGGGHDGDTHEHETADDGGEEDSDRPEWAGTPGRDDKPGRGNTEVGVTRGSLFGDMYVLLRDPDGVPVLTAEGFVQPLDENGNPIPLDEEGHPVDETLTVEVELGRLNVGRSPLHVLSARYEEAIGILNSAETISLDPAGRIEYTIDGVTKAIDSPLENLAFYVQLINTGTLAGVIDTSKFTGDLAVLVDGQLTVDDYAFAASLFAASADKSASVSIDTVVYMNTILDIAGTLPDPTGGDLTYVDYSAFNYDRSDVYGSVTTTVLVLDPATGEWVPTTVNIYDAVFGGVDYTSADGGVDGFAQATDDARAVIEYIHDHAVPEEVTN